MLNTDENKEMQVAWKLVSETDTSVFLTGKAGTGKTTFLRKIKQVLPKRMVVLAPTGVAAINAQGQTIHSFFQLPLSPFVPGFVQEERKSYYRMSEDKKKLLRSLDLLIIDEISMVRADLLDAVDMELRKYRNHDKPFGGVQLLMIGDLCQLSPVVKEDEWNLLSKHYQTPYFFSSKALQMLDYSTIELQIVYRQENQGFVDILGKIRKNELDDSVVETLNSRFIPDFEPPHNEDWIRLTTHNAAANNYNQQKLNEIETTEHEFCAEVKGNFPELSYPADEKLILKVGAQVMFIKNDISSAHAFYNGKIGVVCGITDDKINVWCKGTQSPISVERMEWENKKFVVDEVTKDIKETTEGTFSQFPLRLAWAITIHKSQGLTFDHAVLDINRSFAHGQVYVALSRCRTLEGLVLSAPIYKNSIISDSIVDDYFESKIVPIKNITDQLPEMKYAYFKRLLDELFDFGRLMDDFTDYFKVFGRFFIADFPEAYGRLQSAHEALLADIQNVSERFKVQYDALCNNLRGKDYQNDELLNERIRKASIYFSTKMREILGNILSSADIPISDKAQLKRYNNVLAALSSTYKLKLALLEFTVLEGFNINNYLKHKGRALASEDTVAKAKKSSVRRQRTRRKNSAI